MRVIRAFLRLWFAFPLLAHLNAVAEPGWVLQYPEPPILRLSATQVLDASTVIAVGSGAVRSTDGGSTWTVYHPSGAEAGLTSLSFVDQRIGTAVGNLGTILRTTDGGLNWVRQNSGTDEILSGVAFVSEDVGTAVGSNGTILRTTDGGLTWVRQNSGTTIPLTGVSFVDSEHGTAVGSQVTFPPPSNRSVILHTINGGESWTEQPVPSLGLPVGSHSSIGIMAS